MTGVSKTMLAAYVIGGLSTGLAAWFGAALIRAGDTKRNDALDHSGDVNKAIDAPSSLTPDRRIIVTIVNQFHATTVAAPRATSLPARRTFAPAPRRPPVICGTGGCRRTESSLTLRGNP